MSQERRCRWAALTVVLALMARAGAVSVEGERKVWHRLTLTCTGPETSESAEPNPFLDYRLTVTFRHEASGRTLRVPGYYAADGRAGQSGADAGPCWRAQLLPDAPGVWSYALSFRRGRLVAVRDRDDAGVSAGFMDGQTGRFEIAPTDKTGPDFRAQGRLDVVGRHHLRCAGSGRYFLKCGVDAPETLLACADFDGPFARGGQGDRCVKTRSPHVRDWREGDPTWRDGKGKGLIGALNYLAGRGLNAVSFLTLADAGDDRNVSPYTTGEERLRFDCSRLDQWEIVFEHASRLGLHLQLETEEAENQGLLGGGGMGLQRRLYYRELIARFGHHPALTWKLGEENGDWQDDPPTSPQNTVRRRAVAHYVRELDPYGHLVAIRGGRPCDDRLGPDSDLTGVSVQTGRRDFAEVYGAVKGWIERADAAGKPWVVACDAQQTLRPDSEDPNHDDARRNALWGVLMAGGAGIEWHLGGAHARSDSTCPDWRSRERMWAQCAYALTFCERFAIPFWAMRPLNERCPTGHWVLGGHDDAGAWVFLVYLKQGGDAILSLPAGRFDYGWFDPRRGFGLVRPGRIGGPAGIFPFQAPDTGDWVLLLRQSGDENAL